MATMRAQCMASTGVTIILHLLYCAELSMSLVPATSTFVPSFPRLATASSKGIRMKRRARGIVTYIQMNAADDGVVRGDVDFLVDEQPLTLGASELKDFTYDYDGSFHESSELDDSIPLHGNERQETGANTTLIMDAAAAATAVEATEPDMAVEAPDVKKVLRFAIPAIGVWLCSPLLSLIDTSAVGLLSGTAQQAALNPAVAVTDYGSLLVAFIYTATTNLVAAAQETDRGVEGKSQTRKTMIAALQLATFVGITSGAAFGVFSKGLLKTIIGNDSIDPTVFAAALRYVRIRALGMPAAVVIGSAQAACLGLQDIRSPLYVLLAAAVVNFCGDMLFVGSSNPLLSGAAGAAWATVFSQYAALFMFLAWLQRKPQKTAGNEKQKSGSLMTRGFLAGKFRKSDLLKCPPLETAKQFWPYVIPVTTTAIGRVSGYIAMSHVVSSSLGMVDMAAQQILLAFFTCFTPICDSLNLTAQSFVPGIFERKGSQARTAALKQTIQSFVKAGGIMGAALLGAVACIPLLSKFFTLDAAVIGKVTSATPFVAGIFALGGIVCAGEGLLLGQKDLGFLGKAYTAYFFAVPYFLLRLKKAATTEIHSVGVASMWKVFLVYQSIRCTTWLVRLHQLHRRRKMDKMVADAA